MKNFVKGKFGTAAIIMITLILAGIAVFTAYRLYQLRQQPVAPNVPSSFPKAEESSNPDLEVQDTAVSAECHKTYTVTTGGPTDEPTASPTNSPTASPTDEPGEPNSCGGTCGSNINCADDLYCNTSVKTLNGVAVTGVCRNPSCPTDTDCVCSSSGSSPTATATSRASTTTTIPTEAALPQSGTNWPTFAGIAVGVLVILGSLLLAF